ncbi:SDR family NAD(P)-dependent oxidoreductase [Sphingomonas sp. M1-B02]|uniref:SDR family NAD(P)-dependent oxidoreductase n=1 Tax=Sphingomonas sp. M1-B02 TaxID=3114300 RepID=UPI00223E970B|nr:SDR family NAD(P)-dependent oxidoreductase [Sphingomonas sp. S6-11]UZK67445.1 SDR family NAD(P)-dependent oxidoreductase [Sphingomonas sp. S6-11]
MGLALVTGGSSGIGLELARCLARDGHGLILVAQDVAKLERAATELYASGAPKVETWSIDLSRSEGAPAMFEQVRQRATLPDFLLLNAGTGAWGDFVGQTDLALELESIQVNIVSVVQAAKLFLPEMVKRGSGRVLITSSVTALGPSPRLAVYSGTKAFLHTFAEAVREEIADSGVTITSLMPDLTESGFFERAHVDPDSLTAREPKADPATVAKAGYEAMLKGKDHVVAPSFPGKLKAAAASILPTALVTKIARAD